MLTKKAGSVLQAKVGLLRNLNHISDLKLDNDCDLRAKLKQTQKVEEVNLGWATEHDGTAQQQVLRWLW